MLFQSHEPTVPTWSYFTAGTTALLGIIAGGVWWYNRHTNGHTSSHSNGASSPARYEDWTYEELYHRAQEEEIQGRSTMNKSELIEALRTSQ